MSIEGLPQVFKINRDILLDVFWRLVSCVCVGYFIYGLLGAFVGDKTRVTLIAAIFSEVATVVVSLLSRRPMKRDWSPPVVVATAYAGTLWLPLLTVTTVTHLLPETVSLGLQLLAALWVINAKVTLGRSFGWLPANRGVVDNGVYRFIRHPIYFGYALGHLGFLLANFNLQNAAVLATVYVAQIYRILQEEKFLIQDPTYRAYAAKVPYRLIYGVF